MKTFTSAVIRHNLLAKVCGLLLLCPALTPCLSAQDTKTPPPVVHSEYGDKAVSADGRLTLTNIGKKQQYGSRQSSTFDSDIHSPKSAAFHPDGSRVYVNSLEGCRTIVYDARSLDKLKVINHRFRSGKGALWGRPSGHYPWTHYPEGERSRFSGKPVEMTFSHGGRYLWVPYYRRSFDINAQDPSAVAVIDTRSDSIVRMFETGPLPKMVAGSNSGQLMSVTHWGDNTVGLIDISGTDPKQWRHLKPVTIGRKLKLDFPLDSVVNRDANSGFLLRGTVFTPDDRYMLVGCMAGHIAVVDMASRKHIGFINNLTNVRHLVVHGKHLYASCNVSGMVWKIPTDSIDRAISRAKAGGKRSFRANGWKGCKVGRGARTIEVSPDGRYIFAACNSASRVDVVDARTMKPVTSIRCDSYPVGLALSTDGSRLVVTSQGRQRKGGNAVNIFSVSRNER